jgi:hypothetical protein
MTFDELELSLPNGFHDATILGISFDCYKSSAMIRLSVHVSADDDDDRERYRIGLLDANSIHLFFIDRPDPNYNLGKIGKGISVSGDSVHIGQDAEIDVLLRKLPPGVSAYRFFMEDWNSFFYIAASVSTFSWE